MLLLLFTLLILNNGLYAQFPSFPGAEGFGTNTIGGRGGKVLIVTSLDDSMEKGTLRWAVNQQFPRIIVFEVSGIIELNEPLYIGGSKQNPPSADNPYSYCTIAGQSAPGEGIIITNYSISLINDIHDVVIRNIRVRKLFADTILGTIGDGIELGGCNNVVIDHCSVSWAVDEGISIESTNSRMNNDITIQNCIVGEGLLNGGHPGGTQHSRGIIASDGSFNVSIHHNFMISNNRRNPSLGGNSDLGQSDFPLTDVRYNLIYNYGEKGIQFGGGALANIVGNIIKNGPQTSASKPIELLDRKESRTSTYLSDNCLIYKNADHDVMDCPSDQLELVLTKYDFGEDTFRSSQFDTPSITPAAILVDDILSSAGALPHDSTDRRFVYQYQNNMGSLGAEGLTQEQIELISPNGGEVKVDTDRDGMPDDWEIENGLDPSTDDSTGDVNANGYSNIEDYLNSFYETTVTSVNSEKIPKDLVLLQNYPNPFNPTTTIEFSVPNGGNSVLQHAELIVYDITGKKVTVLINQKLPPGNHITIFDGRSLSSGVYFYRLSIKNNYIIKKMVLLR